MFFFFFFHFFINIYISTSFSYFQNSFIFLIHPISSVCFIQFLKHFFYSLLHSHFCNFSMNIFPSLNLFLHSDIHISFSFFLFFSIQFLFIHLISSLLPSFDFFPIFFISSFIHVPLLMFFLLLHFLWTSIFFFAHFLFTIQKCVTTVFRLAVRQTQISTNQISFPNLFCDLKFNNKPNHLLACSQ